MKQALTSISLERPLLDSARKVAKTRRQSFSAYVATLLEMDLKKAQAQQKLQQEAV